MRGGSRLAQVCSSSSIRSAGSKWRTAAGRSCSHVLGGFKVEVSNSFFKLANIVYARHAHETYIELDSLEDREQRGEHAASKQERTCSVVMMTSEASVQGLRPP